ncbi:MAG TPA: hypothetical protein VFE41_33860 [Acetobacteraceae bacterium]|jgi:hypothetical protein|nr:hypothetical protein [Acetobacteraceae bacterium]
MGMAAKTKEPAAEQIMAVAKMKPLLALSKREPVNAAVALTSDGEGVVLLDKKMKPKKVLATLKADAAKAKIQLQAATFRFGKAEVDTDYDPGMVRFFVNKEAPGNMRAKLVVVFKQIAYQKVEFNVDPTFEDESEDDEQEGQERTTATPPIQQTAPTPPPPAPPPPPVDLSGMVSTLRQLMQAIPKVAVGDPALQTSLVGLATTAQTSLQAAREARTATDLPVIKAQQDIDALRSEIAKAMEQAKQKAQGAGGAEGLDKSGQIWLAIRKKVETDIETLRQRIVDTFKDDAIAPQLDTSYKAKVAPVLATLDDSLAVTLGAATKATDAAQRTKLIADAKTIMQKYAQYVTSEPLLKDLDENPFVPLTIRASVGGTLSTLSKAIH